MIAIFLFLNTPMLIVAHHFIKSNSRPGVVGLTFNYYVYILDLCFILPVCVVSSIFLFQKKILGFLLGGIISIFGFALMLWVALGFFCQPFFDQNLDVGNAVIFSIITFVFLVLSIFYFVHAKIIKRTPAPYSDREFSKLSSGSY